MKDSQQSIDAVRSFLAERRAKRPQQLKPWKQVILDPEPQSRDIVDNVVKVVTADDGSNFKLPIFRKEAYNDLVQDPGVV